MTSFEDLYEADAEARGSRRSWSSGWRCGSCRDARATFLAALGFAVLIILHEFGHFTRPRATGMRVERFMLVLPADPRR